MYISPFHVHVKSTPTAPIFCHCKGIEEIVCHFFLRFFTFSWGFIVSLHIIISQFTTLQCYISNLTLKNNNTSTTINGELYIDSMMSQRPKISKGQKKKKQL